MRIRIGLTALAVAVIAAGLISGAGAGTQRLAAPGPESSSAAIAGYLRGLGLDPAGIVVQRGQRNYAGPSCPGKGWTCTTSTRVLQIASDDGDHKNPSEGNRFQCTPSPGGASDGAGNCTIVQVSDGGTNEARCAEASSAAGVAQSCIVYQTNTTGDNEAHVKQVVDANDGPTQDASQYGGVIQTNGAGSNQVELQQDIRQSTKSDGPAQTQDGHQAAYVRQRTDLGDNSAEVHQNLQQKAKADGRGADVTQSQNTRDEGPNTNAAVDQTSTLGQNVAHVNQTNDLDAHAMKTGATSQQQGTQNGGLNGWFSQLSSGLSVVKGEQNERQTLKAEKTGALSQVQWGPAYWDPTQGSNPGDRYDLDQRSSQQASDPTFQSNEVFATCTTTGTCTADQRVQQQNDRRTNSCSGDTCTIGVTVVSAQGETNWSTCSGSPNEQENGACYFTPPPPPPPPNRCQQIVCDEGPPPPPREN